MPSNERTYSLSELCALADVTPRTVRYYIAEGLLRSPGAGQGARYGNGHLHRLRLIRRLQREHFPLAEIRNRLAMLSDEEAGSLLAAPEPSGVADSAVDYIRTILGGGTSGFGTNAARMLRSTVPSLRSMGQPARVLREEAALFPPAPAAAPGISTQVEPDQFTSSDPAPAASPNEAPYLSPPPPPERSQWERISLAPDVELHLRRPLSRIQNRQVARLLDAARDIFQEEKP